MARRQELSATSILVIAFAAMLSGHMLLKAYMPNIAFGGMGFLLIVLLFSYVLFIRRDVFGFVLVIYVCSHFSYADNQGGLWNLMALGMLILYKLLAGKTESFRRPDILMTVLLGIFILWNMLGWSMKNPIQLTLLSQGIAALFGFVLVYYITSNLVINKERFRVFLTITLFMLLYQLVVALNQRYQLLAWNTPLLGGYTDSGTSILPGIANTQGTIGHFELFGEYAALMLCLLVPLLSSSATQRDLEFSSNRLVVMVIICLIIPMMTSTRSAALLIVFTISVYYFVFLLRIFPGIDRVGRQLRIILVVGILMPVIGVYVGMQHLQEDLSDLSGQDFTVKNIGTGDTINRGGLTTMAIERIGSESWWVGYGLGVPRSNRWAWFGMDTARVEVGIADFHSLYLSIPMLYGWIGSLAFLAMIMVTMFRVAGAALSYRRRENFLAVVAIGFSMFWVVFMADQYKISIMRNPGYHMLFWIWLGLTHAVIKTLRTGKTDSFAAVPAESGNIRKKIM